MSRQTLGEGKYLRLLHDGKWEYVERKKTSGVVVILPLTRDEKIILVEQPRAAVGHPVIGLPAGLAGDGEKEELLAAAQRELREETGATSTNWSHLTTGPSSPGLTSEMITFFVARDIARGPIANPDSDEKIEVHEIPLRDLQSFLRAREKQGALIDYKIFAALYLAGSL